MRPNYTQVATSISMKVATYVTSRQKTWLEAIQDRINFTSEILGSMMSVKMLGLTNKMAAIIQAMRVRELDLSKRFRRLSSFNVCLGKQILKIPYLHNTDMLEVNLPQILSQFFTFAAFAVMAKVQGSSSLSISQAITALSILTLLSTPLSGLLIAISQGFAALGCFQRIQEFLLGESRLEQRIFGSNSKRVQDSGFPESPLVFPGGDIELTSSPTLQRHTGCKDVSPDDQIVIKSGIFGWSETNLTVINDLTMQIPQNAQLTIIVGPVGCGKSTFLKALLGETSIFGGFVYVKYLEIAFCDQTPWISNGSIRDNIIGESSFEDAWYNSVVWACALDADLQQMPNGDATIVGSKGVMLSGGQKQRLVSTLSLHWMLIAVN